MVGSPATVETSETRSVTVIPARHRIAPNSCQSSLALRTDCLSLPFPAEIPVPPQISHAITGPPDSHIRSGPNRQQQQQRAPGHGGARHALVCIPCELVHRRAREGRVWGMCGAYVTHVWRMCGACAAHDRGARCTVIVCYAVANRETHNKRGRAITGCGNIRGAHYCRTEGGDGVDTETETETETETGRRRRRRRRRRRNGDGDGDGDGDGNGDGT